MVTMTVSSGMGWARTRLVVAACAVTGHGQGRSLRRSMNGALRLTCP
jgi:hypothetical protein